MNIDTPNTLRKPFKNLLLRIREDLQKGSGKKTQEDSMYAAIYVAEAFRIGISTGPATKRTQN